MFPPIEMESTLSEIVELLVRNKQTISVSESACGGLISSYLVSRPGATTYYHGSTLAYSLKSRLKLSGWSESDIETYTGPSEQVARKLARNLKLELGTTWALSETGWAGPSGDNIGTVFLAVSRPDGSQTSITATSPQSSRPDIMCDFARLALQFLLAELRQCQ